MSHDNSTKACLCLALYALGFMASIGHSKELAVSMSISQYTYDLEHSVV